MTKTEKTTAWGVVCNSIHLVYHWTMLWRQDLYTSLATGQLLQQSHGKKMGISQGARDRGILVAQSQLSAWTFLSLGLRPKRQRQACLPGS